MYNLIAFIRKEHGYSQKELAEILGISREHLIRIEQEKHSCSIDLAFELAKVFNCKVDDLFYY